MKKQIFVEMAIADHFEITDRLDFPIEGFAWPSLTA